MYIPHSKPTLGKVEQTALKKTLASPYIAQGEKTSAFEKAFSKYLGMPDAVATNSGTSALHLVLLAMGIKSGDEVIIPSYVCTAVLNAVNYTGAKALIADVEADFNISCESTKLRIGRRTKAIILPHIFGYPSDIAKFLALGIPIIEDCAQSIGALYKGRKVGTFGKAAVFSFYATKMITTGYGGMVASHDKTLLAKIRNSRDFDNRTDYVTRYNYQMSDLGAALGLAQLKQLPEFIQKRQAIARKYDKAFNLDITQTLYSQPAFWRYIIKTNNLKKTIQLLQRKGIESKRPVYKPIHRYLRLPRTDFPTTEMAYRTALSIPIYPALARNEIKYIIDNVLQILK